MKIVRIIARLNVGGPARHVVWLTREQQNGEFRSVLVAGSVPAGEEDMGYFAAENNVKPIYIKEMSRELSPRDIVSLWKVYDRIRREKPDIIHTHTAKAGTIGRVAGFLFRWLTPGALLGRPRPVKFVHTYHGHVFHSYYGRMKTALFLSIERMLARLTTDRIVVISDQQFEEIHRQFGVGREEQFAVIPLGIDLAPFENAEEKRRLLRDEIGAAGNEILVGLVGRLTAIKNVPLLLRAAERIAGRRPETASPAMRFVVIGDGDRRKELEKEAEEIGRRAAKDKRAGPQIEFLGNRDDPAVFYAGLDIVALTSLNEGTPLSLIEAMAAGRAVISTAVGGVVDLLGPVREEKEGFTIRERGITTASADVEGFSRGLEYLAANPELRREFAEKGRRFVRENYSKERLVRDIAGLYREISKPA